MLRAVPKSLLSWDFVIEDDAGAPWGEISLAFWRQRGWVGVGDRRYRVSRKGLMGPFVLEGSDGELCQAVKVSPFKQRFTLSMEKRTYALVKLSWLRREFGLFRDDTLVGSVAPESWFSRRAKVDLPDDMPEWLRGFVVWLVMLMWKRDSEATAAGNGA